MRRLGIYHLRRDDMEIVLGPEPPPEFKPEPVEVTLEEGPRPRTRRNPLLDHPALR